MNITQAIKLIAQARHVVGFTGAGISTESGIPDFRSPGGVWSTNRIIEYDEFISSRTARIEAWRQKAIAWPEMRAAQPNAGHRAFVELERQGKLTALITQNIDGLHQEAGSREVLELHGSWRTMACLRCRRRVESRSVSLTRLPPLCECGGALKPDVTLFGEFIPSLLIDAAWEQARSCDCLVVVGTSADVAPASAIPMAARDCGAFVIEINIQPTPLSDAVVDLRIQGPAGVILPRLAEAVGVWREN